MKGVITSVIVVLILIGGSFALTRSGGVNNNVPSGANNVTVIDGIQVVEITARGGYIPRKSYAQAGLPTILRFSTNGTFDCSSAIRIPSLNVSKILPQTGKTDVDIGTPKVSTLKGSCSMGMYPFEVEFTS